MIKYHDVVGQLLLIVHYHFRTALTERLDDFSSLRPGASMRLRGKSAVTPACGAVHFHDSLSVINTLASQARQWTRTVSAAR